MKTISKCDTFSYPVSVFGGIGMIQKVNSVCEALAFLDGWPVNDCFGPRIAAHLICLSALEGELKPAAARQAFSDFAEAAGILIAEPSNAIAA